MPISGASTTDLVVLSASQVTTAGTNVTSTPLPIYGIRTGVIFVLDVTAAGTSHADALDVYVQAGLEGQPSNETYVDAIHFTQVLGDGGAVRLIAKITNSATQAAFDASAALTAGNQRAILGDYWRVKYTVTNDTAPSFTWSLTALPF